MKKVTYNDGKLLSSVKKVTEISTAAVSECSTKLKQGSAVAKTEISKVITVTKENVVKATEFVQTKGKSVQIAAINYIDSKKNKRFLDAKLTAFEDGLKEGKVQAADYIKKYFNFCLAATALSYYFARCDGSLDDSEMLEIQFDLDSILKNKDLPDSLKNEMYEISNDKDLSFEKVKKYLDCIGNETLIEFKKDADEIIFADGKVTSEEAEAKKLFYAYLTERMGDSE